MSRVCCLRLLGGLFKSVSCYTGFEGQAYQKDHSPDMMEQGPLCRETVQTAVYPQLQDPLHSDTPRCHSGSSTATAAAEAGDTPARGLCQPARSSPLSTAES